MFDPNQIADPETLALELLIEDQANQPDDPYLEWFTSCEEIEYRDYLQRIKDHEPEPERPTFTAGWRYNDNGTMPTIPPYPVNDRPFAQ